MTRVFGYGSLIWKPSFAFDDRRTGWVEGWARRFWQGSPDHRGLPDAPGRVVTLVPEPSARCWGVTYRLASNTPPEVLDALDVRESGGYSKELLTVHHADGSRTDDVRTYVATSDNPFYLGDAPLESLAEQVKRSHGPSGSNADYVLRLAEALRGLGAEDEHVFALERLVR